MATIYPTHQCFDDAFDFIGELIRAKRKYDLINLYVVHSICLMGDGEPYAHCWIEDDNDGSCIFRGIISGEVTYLHAPVRNEFYEEFQVQETTRYSMTDAWKKFIETDKTGPWEEKYERLTRNYKKNQRRMKASKV